MNKGQTGLVADIGATNARFALVARGGAIGAARVYQLADHPSLAAAIEIFLTEEGAEKPARAVLAVAAPIAGDHVGMTNHPAWSFSIEALRTALGLERLRIINDFTANAYAIPYLQEEGDFTQIGSGRSVAEAPAAILGPGTGLGVSALIPASSGAIAIEGEGGHVTMAASEPREAAVLAHLRARYDRVSAERVLSGPGLVNIYEALCGLAGVEPQALTPAEVAGAGLSAQDRHAREALAMFCAMLGGFAGDVALTLGAHGGVYIAGGIAPKLGDFLVASGFRASFERKGRLKEYMEKIPTFLILRESPALLGAASLLE
jgi:glucokinase